MKRAIVLALVVAACVSNSTGRVSAFDTRIGVAAAAWSLLTDADRRMLENGQYRIGMPEIAAYIARGRPTYYWDLPTAPVPCRVLLYSYGSSLDFLDRAIYTCRGEIVHSAQIEPPLPCWRVAEVAPRIAQRDAHWFKQTLSRQWEILYGTLRRGQASEDVYIAFGKPYNTGRETREDGTEAATQVFLDHGGESYGLYITMIDSKVASWKIPAEREMTPEAQKARMDAMEKRLTAKLRQMEETAEKRHRETVAHLNTIQENQKKIREDVAQQTEKVAAAAALGGYVGGSLGNGGGGEPEPVKKAEKPGKPGKSEKPDPAQLKGETCKCPQIKCAGGFEVQTCMARCFGAKPVCDCGGRCPSKKDPQSRPHDCGCK